MLPKVNKMRWFNTAGPNRIADNYTLPALARLPEAHDLIAQNAWLVLHAPRQTGKTTTMMALAAELTASGKYAAIVASCETGAPFGQQPLVALDGLFTSIAQNSLNSLPEALRPPPQPAASAGALVQWLSAWCGTCPIPVVILLDEIDALQDDALISVLRQLRSIYPSRPQAAPSTVALIGLRDVRDYKVASGGSPHLGTQSPFNVSVASLTLRSFTQDEVAQLYGQHTAETGQIFADEAIQRAFYYTQGQPWLVNALAYEMVTTQKIKDTLTADHVDHAKEQLILQRRTHLDSLADKLNEPRVRAVIEPILTGQEVPFDLPQRDVEYCCDLGLIAKKPGEDLQIANPIYREVLPRELTEPAMLRIRVGEMQNRWALPDGHLNLDGLLLEFVDFWHQHGEWMVRGQVWPEAAHQIVLMAFLQRIVNGGGWIEREYGLGTQRLDLLIRWHLQRDKNGVPIRQERFALEVKVWRQGQGDPTTQGLKQLDSYCEKLGLSAGTLIVFDARDSAPPYVERGVLGQTTSPAGRAVRVLRA